MVLQADEVVKQSFRWKCYIVVVFSLLLLLLRLMDDHISSLIAVHRLYDKGLSSKTFWPSLLKNELSVQFEIISTRTLRTLIQNASTRHANEYFIESEKTQIKKKYFDFKRSVLWTSHHKAWLVWKKLADTLQIKQQTTDG